jgi:hypothetical protein
MPILQINSTPVNGKPAFLVQCETCDAGRCAPGEFSCGACRAAHQQEIAAAARRKRVAMTERLAAQMDATAEEAIGLFIGIARRAGNRS